VKRTNHTEDWLGLLLFGADLLLNPAPAKFLQGYESWSDRRRLRRHFRRLEERQLLRSSRGAGEHTLRLTERGRQIALGGRDPFERWQRPWDGKWRMVMFDLPTRRQSARIRLIRWLRKHHYGFLQRSVWVHPDAVEELRQALQEWADDAETVTVLEAGCAPGYSNTSIVMGAWDFDEINKRYGDYLKVAARESQLRRKAGQVPEALAQWLRDERAAWLHAVNLDPLLPQALLPPGYLGQKAAACRRAVLASVQGVWKTTTNLLL